jgi:DNA-binding CsgD family transcriptional regulator
MSPDVSARMQDGLQSLNEREKEVLRLLVRGHDAKSMARSIGLSVHTVNERLREARRKMGVSNSKQAARLLAEAEKNPTNSFGDKEFGVAKSAAIEETARHTDRRSGSHRSLTWIAGGMLIMSLIVAGFAALAILGDNALLSSVAVPSQVAQQTPTVPETAGSSSAREWVGLLDGQQWSESWNSSGSFFRSQIASVQWTSTIQSVRLPLGRVTSRQMQSVTATASLPNAPAGQYEVVQFKTNFAQKRDAIETVVLARESSGWKVNGYFIR